MNIFQSTFNVISKTFLAVKDLFRTRQEKLIDAIKKGDEKRVEKFLREEDRDFIKHGSHSHSILEVAANSIKNPEIAKIIIKKCRINLNSEDVGLKFLNKAIIYKNNEVAKFLFEELGISISENKHQTLLSASISFGNSEIISYMIKKNLISFDASSNANMTAGNYLALYNDAEKYLQESNRFQSKQEIEDYIKLSKSKAIIAFSYSTDGFGSNDFMTDKIFNHAIKNHDFPEKDKIRRIMDLTFHGKNNIIDLQNGNRLKVLRVPYIGHAAFALVEYDKNKTPITLTYCDGNSNIGNSNIIARTKDNKYGYGAITFKFDEKKVKILEKQGGWEKFAAQKFQTSAINMYKNNAHNFFSVISNFVCCDDKEKPIIFEKSIPTKSQTRGNCSIKSRHNVLREILRRSDETMVFEIDGKPGGKGYEVYKEYKKHLIEPQIENLLQLANSDENNPYHQEALQSLKKVFLKAVQKGNKDLTQKIKEVFIRDNVDISQIKDERGFNCLFQAATKSQIEIFKDFINSGILPNTSQQVDGNNILHYCCKYNSKKEIIDIILSEQYCNPKVTNFDGNTPLHQAIISKNDQESKGIKTENLDQVIDLLIEKGGASDSKNKKGYSPEQLAKKYGYEKIATKISEKLEQYKSSKIPKNEVYLPKSVFQDQNKNFESKNSTAVVV